MDSLDGQHFCLLGPDPQKDVDPRIKGAKYQPKSVNKKTAGKKYDKIKQYNVLLHKAKTNKCLHTLT